jgi:hypothetical protein
VADVRAESGSWISRKDVAAIIRRIDSQDVDASNLKGKTNRGRYSVKGPNRVWSIDGHDKLTYYGFGIYGIINGLSRFVIDHQVGIGNRTAVACRSLLVKWAASTNGVEVHEQMLRDIRDSQTPG